MKKVYVLSSIFLTIVSLSFSQSNLQWATYYGQTGDDLGRGVVTDASGGFQNAYGEEHMMHLLKGVNI